MNTEITGLAPEHAAMAVNVRIRALAGRVAPAVLDDPASVAVAEAAGCADMQIPDVVVLVHAVRTATIDARVRSFVAAHPDAVVVDLGCGLDPRRHRCAPPPGVDWFDVDVAAALELRDRYLPDIGGQPIAADLTGPADWVAALPTDRPTIAVAEGLMVVLNAAAFRAAISAVAGHARCGEAVFNAYPPFALRAGAPGPALGGLRIPGHGGGFLDPHEPERWGAGLTLVEEALQSRSPEVAHFPAAWRVMAWLTARSTRLSRTGDRVLRYRF